MTNEEKELIWLEAAYLYYLHPEHGQLVPDGVWDQWGRELGKPGSLFHFKEEDYPETIRNKYANK